MIRAPGQPAARDGSWCERDRWEWRWSPGVESPFMALERFLADAGLAAVRDLTGRGPARPSAEAAAGRGAVLLIGGGWPVSAAGGAASPCPLVPDVAAVVVEHVPAGRAPDDPTQSSLGQLVVGEWQQSWSAEEHRDAVEEVRRSIARGDVYQANVVGHRSAPFAGSTSALARRLEAVPDAPWSGGISGAGWSAHAASPELFLEVAGGHAQTRPIKGTSARAKHPVEDQAAYDALRQSPKDRAEHVMIVDLERNDLAQVAVTGGVDVTELYVVRPLAGLWHAESTVSAELRPGVGLADLLAAAFPGGSVTGAPKRAALTEIARVEPVGRGPAMGALGWVGADATVRLGLTIRTVAVTEDRLHLWTGGGVTWSSDPAAEVAEAAAKAAPLLRALTGAAAGC